MNNPHVDHDSLFESVYTFAPIGISLVSPDGIWMKANKALCSMLGYTQEEIVGRSYLELTYAGDREENAANVRLLLDGKLQLYETQKRYIHKDGSLVWASLHVSAVREEGSNKPLYLISHIIDCTEKKKTEDKLLETEKRCELITNHALDIISYLDPNGIIGFCSPVIRDLLGFEPEELIGKDFRDLLHPDDLSNKRSLHTEDTDAIRHRILHKNGSYVWFESMYKLVRDDSGAIQNILGISRNITERKQHDLRLEESQRIALLGSWEWDIEKNRFTYSQQVADILALDPAKPPTHPRELLECVDPSDRQQVVEEIKLSLDGSEISVEFRAPMPGGDVKHLHLRGAVTLDEAGKLKQVHGTLQDITDRKKTEMKLQETIERYTSLKKYNHDAVFSLDLRGRIINSNIAAQKLTGYPIEQMVGKDFSNYMTSGYIQQVLQKSKEAKENQEPISLEDHIDQIRHKNGHESEVLITVAPIVIHEEVVGFYLIAKDMSEQKKLLIAKESAERMNKAKSDFLAMMSHEIRTPMNGVIGMTELLLTTTELSDVQRDYVELIQKSGDTLLNIVNDILDFSKIEAGSSKLVHEPFDLKELLAETIDLFMPLAVGKQLSLKYSADSDIPDVLIGDALRLKQVITNLVSNAIKFTQTGGVTMRLSVQHREPDKGRVQLLAAVEDSGIGIPEELLCQLFEPFQQLDNFLTRKTKGTGLGLAISKKLVEQMEGEIWVEPSPSRGTTFYFTVWLKTDVRAGGARPDDRQGTEEAGSRQLHILVAEDNEINQLVLKKMLEKQGHRVTVACDGHAVMQAVAYDKYDLIFMDIQMPVMNGIETTKAIRELLPPERCPAIIAVTANALKGDREKYLAAGMQDYISKPLKTEPLLKLVDKYAQQTPAP